MKRMVLILCLMGMFLCACGPKIEGTYATPNTLIKYTFESNGKVIRSLVGVDMEFDYKIEGNKIKINTPEGTMVLTLLDDGSIDGPFGNLKKQ